MTESVERYYIPAQEVPLPEAGSVFMLLQSCLGITIAVRRNRIVIQHPNLLEGVDCPSIRNPQIGQAIADLSYRSVTRVPRG